MDSTLVKLATVLGLTSSAALGGKSHSKINLRFSIGILPPSPKAQQAFHVPPLTSAGLTLSITLFAIPALLSAPPGQTNTMLSQWRNIYTRGATYSPPFSAVAAATLSYAAWAHYTSPHPFVDEQGRWKGLVAAAVGTVAIVPFTLLVLMPTNRALITGADGGKLREEAAKRLVRKWGVINGVRALFSLVGAMVGLWSLL